MFEVTITQTQIRNRYNSDETYESTETVIVYYDNMEHVEAVMNLMLLGTRSEIEFKVKPINEGVVDDED